MLTTEKWKAAVNPPDPIQMTQFKLFYRGGQHEYLRGHLSRIFPPFLRVLACFLFAIAMSNAVQAQALSDPITIIVCSRSDLAEASNLALEYKKKFPNTQVFKAPNGQFAVVIGDVERSSAATRIDGWVQAKLIPADSFSSTMRGYTGPISLSLGGQAATSINTFYAGTQPGTAGVTSEAAPLHRISLESYAPTKLEMRRGERYKYAYAEIAVRANTMLAVTAFRLSGKGDMDTYVVRSIEPNTFHRAKVGGIVAKNTDTDGDPNVTVVSPESFDRTLYIYLTDETIDNSDYLLSVKKIDVAEILGRAAAEALIASALDSIFNSDRQNPSLVLDRIFPLGQSVFERSNVLAIGIDAAINEIRIKIMREYPNSPGVVTFGVSVFRQLLHGVYGDALQFKAGVFR